MDFYFEILHTMQCILMLTKSHGKIGDQMNDLQYQNSTILESNALCSIKKSTLRLKSYLFLFGCWEVNSIWLIIPEPANQRCDWGFQSECMWHMHNLCALASINPLSANSDQKQFSPNNTHTLSRDKVMRINKMITKGKMPWSFIKFSQVILKKIYGDQFGEFVCGYWGLKGKVIRHSSSHAVCPDTTFQRTWQNPLGFMFTGEHFLASFKFQGWIRAMNVSVFPKACISHCASVVLFDFFSLYYIWLQKEMK